MVLKFGNLQDKIALAFSGSPATVEKINSIIQKEQDKEKEQLKKQADAEARGGKLASVTTTGDVGVLSLTDKVLDAIETVIDLEAICDLRITFDIPSFQFPQLPTIDLMFDLSLDTNILEALCRALLELILGILRDLLDCSKLDKFIAGLLSGEIADDSGIYGDLARLFTDPASLAENSNIADSFGNRWDNFVEDSTSALEDLVDFNLSGSVGINSEFGSISFSSVKSGSVGIDGLTSVFKTGKFDNIGPKLAIKKLEDKVTVDVTNVITIGNPDNLEANNFLSEMGLWQISVDQNSFTLSRFSDDRVTVISKIANQKQKKTRSEFSSEKNEPILLGLEEQDADQAPEIQENNNGGTRIREERISGKELFDEIAKLFDSVISLLTPTETINLLSGRATLETVSTVLEIARIKHKRLFLFINTHQKIATLFEMFGKSAGLDAVRNKLFLLSASPKANKKTISIPCPPFDNLIDFRKELLKRTLPEDQVIRIVEQLNDAGKKRFNEIQDGLVKLKKGFPLDIMKPILCGTGKNSNNVRTPIIEDSLNSTINLMFEPTRMMFDREVVKYSDAISSSKEKKTKVPRKASVSKNIPIFNPAATEGNIFSSLTSILGLGEGDEIEDKTKDERINPEFKQMVNSGYVPVIKGDSNGDFEVDGDPKQDYIDKDNVDVFRKESIKKSAQAFKDGIKFEDKDVELNLNNKFRLTLKGSLEIQSALTSFLPFKTPSPEWIIEYTEKNGTQFNIKTNGQINSSMYGVVPFSENYRIRKNEIVVTNEVKQEVIDITDSSTLLPRQVVFGKIFEKKIMPFFINPTFIRDSFGSMFEEKFEDFMKASIREISSGFTRNRLLKKVPNNSLSTLAPDGMALGSSKADQLINIDLINFSPLRTEKQKRCNIDPHLLDFDFSKKIVKEQFEKECEDETPSEERIDGLSDRRGPLNSAGFVGVVMTIVRLYTIESIFKSLFVLDEFKFMKDFAEDDLLIDYITFRMLSDIKRLGFLDEFTKEALIAYEKLLASNTIEPYSNNLDSCVDSQEGESSFNSSMQSEIKALVKHQLESSMERVSTILGVNKKKGTNLKKVFLNGLNVFETFSDFNEDSTYTAINKRFSKFEIPKSGKFILERYVRVKTPSSNGSVIRSAVIGEQADKYLHDVVNFKNLEEFISKIPRKKSQNLRR